MIIVRPSLGEATYSALRSLFILVLTKEGSALHFSFNCYQLLTTSSQLKKTIHLMKTNILFTLIFIGLITWKAQAQYNQNDLVGMWQVNVPKLLKSLPESRKEKMDANQELLSMMFLSNAFQLKKDGSTITQRPSFSGNSKTKQGKWQLTPTFRTYAL